MYVTTNDKIFEASTPFRHASELFGLLKEHYMKDGTNEFQATVLCLLTDGGPDHRVTYDTVQASLLQLFLVLDLDVLVALRTAPYHSWMHPAERCMSILNLALQHCALSREEMSEDFEKMMKSKKTLSAVRNQAELFPALKTAYSGSINPIIKTVNNRFERMKLKGEFLTTYTGKAGDQIDLDLDVVRRATGSDDASFTKFSKSKDFKSDALFQSFLKSHSSEPHYCFQILKCLDGNCYHCTQNPVRDKTVFEKLSFLPEPTPMPDTSGGHYLPFDEVYGKPLTTDKFRPSTKSAEFDDAIVEEDKRNRDIIKSERARDAVKCSECHKPRVIYSASKTTRAQDELLRRLRDEKAIHVW